MVGCSERPENSRICSVLMLAGSQPTFPILAPKQATLLPWTSPCGDQKGPRIANLLPAFLTCGRSPTQVSSVPPPPSKASWFQPSSVPWGTEGTGGQYPPRKCTALQEDVRGRNHRGGPAPGKLWPRERRKLRNFSDFHPHVSPPPPTPIYKVERVADTSWGLGEDSRYCRMEHS